MSFDPWTRRQALLIVVGFEGGLGLLAWLLGWLLGQPPLADCRWEPRALALGVAAALPMLGAGLTLSRWPVGPLVRIRALLEEFLLPLFRRCTILDLAVISLTAGIGEEMLFRGVIQPKLAIWLGAWTALALTSALFGLLHAVTFTYALLAMLAGAYLGWVWLETDNLLVVIVAHALYDFVMLADLLRKDG